MILPPPPPTLFPYTTLFRSVRQNYEDNHGTLQEFSDKNHLSYQEFLNNLHKLGLERKVFQTRIERSEEHTSELQSRFDLVCRLLLEKKNNYLNIRIYPTVYE